MNPWPSCGSEPAPASPATASSRRSNWWSGATLDYLVFECLAERTIALGAAGPARDPDGGYDPLLAERMRAVLPAVPRARHPDLTNMGAANPVAAPPSSWRSPASWASAA